MTGTPSPDFRLQGFNAERRADADFGMQVEGRADDLTSLAEHHTTNAAQSYYVLFDSSATYTAGAPPYLAVHLVRDHEKRSFRFESAELPLAVMAQSWLIHRGCPAGGIVLSADLGPQPADEQTRALERRLQGDGGHFAMDNSYTRDDPEDAVTVVVLRDSRVQSSVPFRVLVEDIDFTAGTYTLREGGFGSARDAFQWCEGRLLGPGALLPPVRSDAPATSPATPTAPAPAKSARSR